MAEVSSRLTLKSTEKIMEPSTTTDQQPQAYRFRWRGIEVEAAYWPRKFGIIAHLEIRSIKPERAPLPHYQHRLPVALPPAGNH